MSARAISLPKPAWLAPDARNVDVVLSSRCRVLRNLVGHKFPHAATPVELEQVLAQVNEAAALAKLDLHSFNSVGPAEKEHFVACRLASHQFRMDQAGHALLLNKEGSLSVMVNEEDHLRIQGLTPGWSIEEASRLVEQLLKRLSVYIKFAWSPSFGYLAASPFNVGEGRRHSSMFHLIGLAQSRRLPTVLKALSSRGLVARGLFGEASRAVGAFVQVSATSGPLAEFVGACEYLLQEERSARASLGRAVLEDKAVQALEFLSQSDSLSLADSLRVLAWARWAGSVGWSGVAVETRQVDSLLTSLELRTHAKEEHAARNRAELLRSSLIGDAKRPN